MQRANYGKVLSGRRFKRAIQHAQEKSEDNAMSARQTTIKFDESLRVQRQKIYRLRDELIYEEITLTHKIDDIFRTSLKNMLIPTPI